MKNKHFKTIGSALITGVFLLLAFGSGSDDSSSSKNKPKKKIYCIHCQKDLTNTYNRISPNHNDNYYCTPCYRKTMKGINEQLKREGY